jgi:hypothetical protein
MAQGYRGSDCTVPVYPYECALFPPSSGPFALVALAGLHVNAWIRVNKLYPCRPSALARTAILNFWSSLPLSPLKTLVAAACCVRFLSPECRCTMGYDQVNGSHAKSGTGHAKSGTGRTALLQYTSTRTALDGAELNYSRLHHGPSGDRCLLVVLRE